MKTTQDKAERVILFVTQTQKQTDDQIWEGLDELEELVRTAGGEVIDKIVQKVEKIHTGHYLGSGKIEELKEMVIRSEATGVVSDDELSPMQMRNLEELLDIKVMDRTMVILDIFAQRAMSREGKIQVEMAQLRYKLTRLTGKGIELSRLAGGIGTRGPGEQKLETDRRYIRERIDLLKKELKEVEKHRNLIREHRNKVGTPVIAIVGYTNAGKSTLLNAISGSDIYAENQLFATLDPTTRKVNLPSGAEVLVTDTVGFIRKLPHHLVKAFYSTLEEAKYADIILHVIDSSSPHIDSQQQVVHDTLQMLGANEKPIIAVLNKTDLCQADSVHVITPVDSQVKISAKTHENIEALLKQIEDLLHDRLEKIELMIPYDKGSILSYIHENGESLVEEHRAEGTYITGYIPKDKYYQVKEFAIYE
ncbi:MAG TPA: GTPase HflX [Epulopiscium sp.]|nr:GTPase HflX [Candidatus Epulonipiscium sp.]